MKRSITAAAAALAALGLGIAPAAASPSNEIPGQLGPRVDSDGNGYADEGVVVTGMFTQTYVEDGTTCDYIVHFRGTFENNPYQDTGWISNNIQCTGEEPGAYSYLIVHETDQRYTGTGTPIWGDWEIHVETASGEGNVEQHANRINRG